MWPICHNKRKPVCTNEDSVQPKIKYKLILKKAMEHMFCGAHEEARKAPRRVSEESGALAAIPPAPRKEQQSHPEPQGPPFLLVGPVPSPSGATRLTEGASGDLGPRLSPATSERQIRDTPKQQRESPRSSEAGGRCGQALCAFPAAGAPGGRVPRGSYVKHTSERLLKTFSGL